MNPSRRSFLKRMGLAGVCGSAVGLGSDPAMASASRHVSEDWTGILVDLTKCNGCRQCEAACQETAGFPVPTKEELLDETVFAKRRRPGPRNYTAVNRFSREGAERGQTTVYVKSNCMHCNDPACVSACLVGAMQKQANGAVTYDAYKCMGCRYCMVACPFEMPTYEYNDVWTPQVRKCTLCSDEGNPHKGGTPACVEACPKQCLIYGTRNQLLVQAKGRIRRQPDVYVDHIYGEQEVGGTSWLYVSKTPFEQLGFNTHLGNTAAAKHVYWFLWTIPLWHTSLTALLAGIYTITKRREDVNKEAIEEARRAAAYGIADTEERKAG